MFHLVKLVFLLSILSGTANAQWGLVVAQSDTNRFITSQEKFGLIMPHQQVIVGLLDTTITSAGTGGGNAFKVIVGSLLDYEDNCANYSIVNGVATCVGSYERWRELEKSTSWYQAARGDTTAMFPTNYAITISTGKDSVVIWNRDTAELWMSFNGAAGNILNITTSDIADIAFKDLKLYVAATGNNAFTIIDFSEGDKTKKYSTSGEFRFTNSIQERNTGAGAIVNYSSSPAIASATVNAVAVARDPFGLKDALGRPKHNWAAGTAGGGSVYNSHKNAIYDDATTDPTLSITLSRSGTLRRTYDGAGLDIIGAYLQFGQNNITGISADGWSSLLSWHSSAAGGADIAWADAAGTTQNVWTEGGSISGQNLAVATVGSSQGVYKLHLGLGDGGGTISDNFARQRFSSTVNAPVEFGDAVVSLAMEDLTVDSSPYANTIVAGGSPGNVSAVFGKGYSSVVGSYMACENQAEFAVPSGDPWAMSVWVKKGAVNSANEQIVHLTNAAVTQFIQIYLRSGTCKPYFHVLNGTGDFVEGPSSICDGEWHHLAVYESGGVLSAFVDGVLVGTDASLAHGVLTGMDDLYVASASLVGGEPRNHYKGLLDDLTISIGTALTEDIVAQIHAEGRKKLGIPSAVFSVATSHNALLSNNVVDIDALDNGMWAVAFSDANSVQVFDGRIPVQEIAAPAGTVKSVALIQNPGADSVGVAIGTTTNLKFVQPAVNLRAAMAHQYKEPIHVGSPVVVDSAGLGGIFWTGDDAVKAAGNAGRNHVYVQNGTYGPVDITVHYMHFECSGAKNDLADIGAAFVGGGSDEALDVTTGVVQINNCSFYTAPGGAGGGYSAVSIIGNNNMFHDNVIIDADLSGIVLHALKHNVYDNLVMGADAYGIVSEPAGDNARINGNFVQGTGSDAIVLNALAENNVVVGNITDAAITDNSGTSTVVGNEQF